MTRTTLDLDPCVLRELRRRGRREHKSMGRVASELLARDLASTAGQSPEPVPWSSWNLGTPRVDLEDKEAVRTVLNQPR